MFIKWPAVPNKKLKEVLLDGDKFFDTDVLPVEVLLENDDWINEESLREIGTGTSGVYKIKFESDIDGGRTISEDYEVIIGFECECGGEAEVTVLSDSHFVQNHADSV